MKKKLKAAELEILIMKRLNDFPECAGITQVYVRETGLEPPEDTWGHTLVVRGPNAPRSDNEAVALHQVLLEMRHEFDLLPD